MTATRTPLLAGNWKLFCGRIDEALRLVDELLGLVGTVEDRDILVAPPFTALASVAQRLAGSRIQVSGQDLYWEDKGAYTGEISGPMLAAAGCSHAIVGHSERRQLFGDTDEWVARKAEAALRADLTPIVCVGETLAEREAGTTLAVVERQVRLRCPRSARRRCAGSSSPTNRSGPSAPARWPLPTRLRRSTGRFAACSPPRAALRLPLL